MSHPILPRCIICSLCKLHFSQQDTNPGQHHPLPSELTKELEDSRKFSLNSLMTLLTVLTVSGSKSMLPVALALLIYTISLRLIVNTCFLQNCPSLLRFLHAIPLLGTFCIAVLELVLGVQSPTIAVVVLLLSVLPLITTIIHHGRRCMEPTMVVLPIRLQDPSATMSSSADMMVSTNNVVEAGRRDIC